MNGNNKNYSVRPLTAEERGFSAEDRNYQCLFHFMRKWGLDPGEWYDLLIIPYLDAVKKYHEYESARKFAFPTVLEKKLYTAVTNEWRKAKRKKRMPEGGICSLDFTMEGGNPFSENQVEEWLIDRKTSVEKQVIFKELFEEFYEGVCNDIFSSVADRDKWLLDMILDGYEMKEIIKEYESRYGKCDPDDWWKTIDYINYALNGRIRRIFKKTFGI